ncbi:cytochrome P450 71D11-like [Andrographis paniculata]|uniref:cytochrome P450 71D11-like n=1 Tax=Andrographis paniculata TaxID=175694 RepID=UPI0021E7C9FA|nr:cytochrome P450 71D11-like [Andrographis paniculata]
MSNSSKTKMEFNFSLSIITIFSFILFLTIFFRKITRSKPDPDSNLPPGPKKLPLIGNLHQLATSSKLTHQTLSDLAEKYGPVIHLQLGQISTIVISSAEAAKEIIKTHELTFFNRPVNIAAEIIFYNHSDLAMSPYGEYWRQLRKFYTVELLSAKRVQSFRALREQEFTNLCQWIASKEGLSIDLTEKIGFTTCDIVMQVSLGKKTDELRKFTTIANKCAKLASGFNIADFYPSIGLFRRLSPTKDKLEKQHEAADRILEKLIDEHRSSTKDESKQHEDFADDLLKFNNSGNQIQLTDANIKGILLEVFTAGIETSSMTTNWIMVEMLRQPRVFKKAQDEVRMVFKDKGFVDESCFDELKYLKLVVKEGLRLHPGLPILFPRESTEQCEIFGYKIPPKTRVLVNAWAIGRDPKYWKEPNSFIPERFLDSPIDYKGNYFEYLPFGSGRRICPGISFGLANIELALALFLYHFDWALPDGMKPEDLDMAEAPGLTLNRKEPLYVIPRVKIPLRSRMVVSA